MDADKTSSFSRATPMACSRETSPSPPPPTELIIMNLGDMMYYHSGCGERGGVGCGCEITTPTPPRSVQDRCQPQDLQGHGPLGVGTRARGRPRLSAQGRRTTRLACSPTMKLASEDFYRHWPLEASCDVRPVAGQPQPACVLPVSLKADTAERA